MLKIEIEPYLLEPDEVQYYYIVVNDIEDPKSFCYQDESNELWSVSLANQEVYEELLNYNFDDLRNQVRDFNFHHFINGYELRISYVSVKKEFASKNVRVRHAAIVEADFVLDAEEWKRPYSVKEFAQAVEESARTLGLENLRYHRLDDDFVTNGFGVTWEFSSEDVMGEVQLQVLKDLEQILSISNELLIQRIDPHALMSYFRFPDEIKTPCTQYLVYFAQFLADLGIDAEVELTQQDSGSTLFKVVPHDKDSSLKAIRDALDAYLVASATQFTYSPVGGSTDIAFMQLQSNVMHLQSQLMLAHSGLKMKDATIEMLELTNFQYKQQLSFAGKAQEEDIIPGVLSVSKLESNGVSVNLAEILKRLKRKLRL